MNAFLAIVRRDLSLALRQGSDAAMALMFFVIVVTLFPLGVGPEPGVLERISAGIVWVAALLAAMLSLDRMFQSDYDDGTLELLLLTPAPLELLVLAKCLAHWLTTGLPMLVIAPLLGLFMNMQTEAFPVLLATMALGTPVLSLIGGIGAALVLGARRAGALVALLVLPLTIPLLIFGVSAIEAAVTGQSSEAQLLIIGAMLLATLPLAPWATAAALRQAVS
ncbi:heme exporter protein CcmB [Nisaea acidiphila]|uniref:Heme exporter protein B n=1 Tax=Nisaea acidiphila TaxID=1862145 RepID=A0A9J7AXD5_9PROT|nr:heme exporter protein CcmB [Nisaea acidiphila]UUX51450.1 heme exporter protein CcmB [Nisaea acidiphila]